MKCEGRTHVDKIHAESVSVRTFSSSAFLGSFSSSEIISSARSTQSLDPSSSTWRGSVPPPLESPLTLILTKPPAFCTSSRCLDPPGPMRRPTKLYPGNCSVGMGSFRVTLAADADPAAAPPPDMAASRACWARSAVRATAGSTAARVGFLAAASSFPSSPHRLRLADADATAEVAATPPPPPPDGPNAMASASSAALAVAASTWTTPPAAAAGAGAAGAYAL